MPQTYLIFDFGADEAAAQNARHKIDGWKQAFRLGAKLDVKFDRQAPGDASASSVAAAAGESGAGKSATNAGSGADAAAETIRVIVRLDFSDHEKLSHQRWLDRIPAEEPFKAAQPQSVRPADASFAETEELFRSLS